MKISKIVVSVILMVGMVGLPIQSFAAVYNFSVTYDGTGQSLDPGSDPMTGTSLSVGDGFLLDLHTAGNDYWEILNSSALSSIYASLLVSDNGTRTGDVETSFYLDGTLISQDIDNNISQSYIHIGAQTHTLDVGTMFDQIVIDYTLNNVVDATQTVIQDGLVFWGKELFQKEGSEGYIAYRRGQQQVPAPSALALIGIGLAALGYARRRKAS